MRFTRYGQSAIHIEASGANLLIDPGNLTEATAFEITGLDAILVTHEHADHIDIERLGQLLSANPGAPVFAPQVVLDLVGGLGVDRARPITSGDQFEFAGTTVEVVGELHQLILPSIPRCANVGFIVNSLEAGRIFIPGDSYETVPENITTLALPLFGPWSSLRETIDFVKAVSPANLFPNHDALLSDAGRALYRRFITQATGSSVRFLDTEQGIPFTLPV